MPELPEVETIRRQLEPEVVGCRIARARVLDERWTRPGEPAAVERALDGRTILAAERRGKYLILRLDGEISLVMHLRMTGNLLLQPSGSELMTDLEEMPRLGAPRLYEAARGPAYLRAAIDLDDGARLLFTDPRRFGHAAVLSDAELGPYLATRLGVEPLSEELTAEELGRRAAGRRAPLKSFLLDQSNLAGVGNIYADEALFRARLHPLSPAGSLKPEHAEELRAGLVGALEAGLRHGGASIDDYLDARGERGSMQGEFLVHRREGEACPRCGETIRRVVVGGRSTYFCPGCQRRLRRRPRRTGRRQSPAKPGGAVR